jgi:hypothetical protein
VKWLGWIVAFLPKRFRGGLYVSAGMALWSGLIELLASLALLIYRYFIFYSQQTTNSELLTRAADKGGETAVMGMGIFSLLVYLAQPVTLLIIYFLLEGIARASAAVVSEEVLSTLPLAILDLGREKKKKVEAEMALGARVPDEVDTLPAGEEELKISTCREKYTWDHMMTIAYQDKLYEVARQEHGEPPRRFVYFLRAKPVWKVVREVHRYSPDEVMNQH